MKIPENNQTVMPYLILENAAAFILFTQKVFGARETFKTMRTENIIMHAEIKVGDTWQKKYATTGKMSSTYTTDYTVKEIEGDHVTLDTRTKIGSSGADKEINGTQNGNIIVDSKTGLMVNAKFDQQINVNSNGQTVAITGTGRINGKAN